MLKPSSCVNQLMVLCGLAGWMFSAANEIKGAETRLLPGYVQPKLKQVAPLGHLEGSKTLRLAIGLPLRDRAGLDELLRDIYDPSSSRYHQYLTSEQFAERFGQTEKDYGAVIEFVQRHGLTVTARHSNRMLLEVEGEAGAIEAMFHISFGVFQHPIERRTVYAPLSDPEVPTSLLVQDIQGLDNYTAPRPMSLKRSALPQGLAQPQSGSAPGGAYRGYDFRNAYAPNVKLNGTGQVVGLLEFDGFYANDIALYEQDTGVRSVPLQTVLLDGTTGAAGSQNPEVALDIEMAISMAPGLSKVLIYEGQYGNSILSRMATDNVAKQLSSSWTFTVTSTTEQLFAQLAVQGQSMFQASGDVDAYYADIPPPSDDPSVTSVGGTVLTTSGPGGSWVSEATWNWYNVGLGFGGSGGGVSPRYNLPSWQKGVSMTSNQGSVLSRDLPDVSLTADNIWVRDNNGGAEVLAGTSASAPLWAGFVALVNQQAKAVGGTNVGFLNPSIYAIGKGAKYATALHDITSGNNTNHNSPTKYFAVPGYDLCTGWGTPRGQGLINALTGVTNVAPSFAISSFTEPVANSGKPYSGSIATQATDPDAGDKLSFSKTAGPGWLAVSASGLLSGTPSSANLGTNSFGVKVTDAGGLSATATMLITVVSVPSFISNPFSKAMANAGRAYTGTVSTNATDQTPGATLGFSKLSGPAWLSIASDGSMSGTPADSDAGTNMFGVGVRDSTGQSNSATMYLLVNGAPYFVAGALLEQEAQAGQPYAVSIAGQAHDPNPGDILTFYKIGGPGWLTAASDGVLSGTPGYSDGGTNVFSVGVADSGGLTNTTSVFVLVALPTPVSLHIAAAQNRVHLDWSGGAGRYQLQLTQDPDKTAWINLGGVMTNQSLSLPLTNSTLFYRVQSL